MNKIKYLSSFILLINYQNSPFFIQGKFIKKVIYVILCSFFCFSYFSQTGKLIVRKTDPRIIGKTLKLADARGMMCGTIYFKDNENCQVNFKMEITKNILNNRFLSTITPNKTVNCSYSVLNYTSLIIQYQNHTDTAYYTYINEVDNLVEFGNTLYGEVPEGFEFAIFYHFDSIIYSQSIKQNLNSIAFTDSLLLRDSIFKNVQNRKLRRQLERDYKARLDSFNLDQTQNYTYFKGRYKLKNSDVMLINSKGNSFAKIKFTKNINNCLQRYYNMYTTYDKCIVNYEYGIPSDTFDATYKNSSIILLNNYYYLNGARPLYTNNILLSNKIKGLFSTDLLALNGNKLKFQDIVITLTNKVYFTNDISTPHNSYYTDSIFFIFINQDTLVSDKISKSFTDILFTYKNNSPFFFGVYHVYVDNQYEFLIFYPDFTGIKFTSNTFDYKEARKLYQTKTLENINPTKITYFNFDTSKDFIWINYQNGGYEQLDFYNFYKGLKIKEKQYLLLK